MPKYMRIALACMLTGAISARPDIHPYTQNDSSKKNEITIPEITSFRRNRSHIISKTQGITNDSHTFEYKIAVTWSNSWVLSFYFQQPIDNAHSKNPLQECCKKINTISTYIRRYLETLKTPQYVAEELLSHMSDHQRNCIKKFNLMLMRPSERRIDTDVDFDELNANCATELTQAKDYQQYCRNDSEGLPPQLHPTRISSYVSVHTPRYQL